MDKDYKKALQHWALRVKERDKGRCVICDSPQHPNAHHILPKEHKHFCLEIDNGITLCPSHHRFSRILSAHQNPLAFFIWMEENRHEQLTIAEARARRMAEDYTLN